MRAGNDVFDEPFNPAFTYPIFGEAEKIFGYKDLELNLRFRAHDLKPSFELHHGEKFKPIGDIKPVDLNEALKDFLSPGVFRAFHAQYRVLTVGRGPQWRQLGCEWLCGWPGQQMDTSGEALGEVFAGRQKFRDLVRQPDRSNRHANPKEHASPCPAVH